MREHTDVVRCRYNRKTLICHGGVRLNRTITPAAVEDLPFACAG